MQDDPWLQRWLPRISAHAAGRPVLEIDCGRGADTATLGAAGLAVVAFDRSAVEIERAQERVPQARFLVRDVREAFPLDAQGTGVILASLSLHYLSGADTVALLKRIRQTLRPGGLLVRRLNSTQDLNFGAIGHPEIERHYHLVDGEPKRFFDQADVAALLKPGWQVLALEHRFTDKYHRPKALWELVCTPAAA